MKVLKSWFRARHLFRAHLEDNIFTLDFCFTSALSASSAVSAFRRLL